MEIITSSGQLLALIGSIGAIVDWSDDEQGNFAIETRDGIFPVSEEVFSWAHEEHHCWKYESGAYLEPRDE